MSIDNIKSHFEGEAKEFDEIIQKLIPYYNLMISSLISAIPFEKDKNFKLIDMGCGTGTIAYNIKQRFPNAGITCVDIAKNMLDIAKFKIGDTAKYIQADFNNFEFTEKYDLIVSSLALHHLETDNDKLDMYKKICESLNENGVFINIDFILGSDGGIQKVYMEKWQEFMLTNVTQEEITDKWLPKYYEEDRPASLINHIKMLESCKFSAVDVIFKYFNFAVIIAKKIINLIIF